IDMNRQQAAQALSPGAFELQLQATVLFTDPARAMAGLGDATGFEWVHLEPWPAEATPGVQMMLNGELKIKGGSLFVSRVRAERLRPLPAGGNARPTQYYSSGSVTGRISGIFSGPSYCGATLTLSNGSSFEARLPGPRFPVPPNMNCPVRIDGIIEDLIGSGGGRIPSVIWAPNSDSIVLAPATDEDWKKLPDFSPAVPLPTPVHLRGILERAGDSESVFIKQGTNRIALGILRPLAAVTGSDVEAAGILASEAGKPVLRNPCLRVARSLVGDASPLLTSIFDVQQYMTHNPTGNVPFKIQGVVTYIDLNMGEFYLQDGDDGLQVVGQMNAGLCPKLSDEGSYVELQGSVESDIAFVTSFAHVLGKGRMPAPAHPSWENLISGAMDNRWVEVEGIIAAADKQRLTLGVAGGRLIAWINELDNRTASALAGSLARVRGVCSPVVNAHNQRLGVRLLVPASECIDMLSLAPEKPFELPLLPMDAIMSADASISDPQERYVRTRGVITCKQGRLLFLQDQAEGLRVTLRDDCDAVPGDVVEAVGRPQPDGFSAKLIQAVIRKAGHEPIPAAVPVDLANVNIGDLAQQRDGTRVELEGTLINESADATRRILNLRNEQARQVFSAYLPANESAASAAPIPEGSRLRIHGIFKAIQDKTPDVDQAATSFEVYVDSSQDVAVLERPSWWTARHTLQLMGLFAGLSGVSLAWIWLLRKQVRQRTHDLALKVEELKSSEVSLAAEVAERKRLQADADQAHKQLLAVAHQAGMAEVATGILHNVGNVLNSVNVSSTVVMDRLRNSRIEGIQKAVALLRQNEAQLGTYLKTEKGRNLLPYLEQIASYLTMNQAGTLKELENLDKNIQHIKDIVAVQQDYAKFSGLTEKLQVIDLMEDALRMSASSLERHKIQVARSFDPRTPLVEADRHKVLQILVNVIRNAEQACDESGLSDKRIVLGVRPAGKGVQISIADNGVGIAPENLDRVFNHGFTTRKQGHGFGLHNAALAAKEMGGLLGVDSPGVGRGACFTLELPTKS
ncbi:MAG TPA: HAMP domain-containing sensor histidine kinase, partial [Candidatus Acidoferrales bacterium]|nr:HAMP domain-containing sensor histidine kinase [Candidatus Acidoferrales bacterium]